MEILKIPPFKFFQSSFHRVDEAVEKLEVWLNAFNPLFIETLTGAVVRRLGIDAFNPLFIELGITYPLRDYSQYLLSILFSSSWMPDQKGGPMYVFCFQSSFHRVR